MNSFNQNEWFIIIALFIGGIVVYFLPKRFPKKITAVFLICGVFFGFFFDHTLSVLPKNYYDLNDSPKFEFFDYLSQCMYAPYSYLYFHLYDRMNIRLRYSPMYILVWALISVGFERVGDLLGIYHYHHGYNLYISFAIYLVVLSSWVGFYYVIKAYGAREY